MHVEVTKKWYFVIALVLLAVGVVAYGTSAPATFGHSATEVDVLLPNGTTVTLQQAVTKGYLNGSSGGSSSPNTGSQVVCGGWLTTYNGQGQTLADSKISYRANSIWGCAVLSGTPSCPVKYDTINTARFRSTGAEQTWLCILSTI